MKPSVWEYQDPVKQISHFRGYVKVYQGQSLTKVYSNEVRTKKSEAIKDAEKLLKTLKHEQSRIS